MLGPEVCLDCNRIFDYLSEDEHLQLRKQYPDIGRWWCSKCKKLESKHYALTIDRSKLEEILKSKDKQ